jgi:hypothetical protein
VDLAIAGHKTSVCAIEFVPKADRPMIAFGYISD